MQKRQKSYSERAILHSNPVARDLLMLMDRKKTNLCVSVDLTRAEQVINLVDAVGPYVCMIKTHVDIIEDFTLAFAQNLHRLAEKHQFFIFEDRKFADTGNTVRLQYEGGLYHISSWANIVNCHTLPGESTVQALEQVGVVLGRACLLLAQMSSKDNLFTLDYTQKTINIAKRHSQFVLGFIAQEKLTNDQSFDFIVMTPGVSLLHTQDDLGQQYNDPKTVIGERESDIIIVGRGIFAEGLNPSLEAEKYRLAGWNAYIESLSIDNNS